MCVCACIVCVCLCVSIMNISAVLDTNLHYFTVNSVINFWQNNIYYCCSSDCNQLLYCYRYRIAIISNPARVV